MFGAPASGQDLASSAIRIHHADFDGDGDLDLAFIASPGLHVRRNDGPLGFVPALTINGSFRDFVVGDFDRDGRPDLAGTSWTQIPVGAGVQYEGRLRTFRNGGPAGGFVGFTPDVDLQLAPPGIGLPALLLAAGDVDADAALDLVVSGSNSSRVFRGETEHGRPTGAFVAPVTVATTGAWMAAPVLADIDADGALDIVHLGYDRIAIVEGQRAPSGRPLGTFGAVHTTSIAVNAKWSIAVADFDRDGLPDLAVGYADRVQLWRGLGNFQFAAPIAFALPAASIEQPFAGDFDRDGRFDLAVPCSVNFLTGVNFRVLRDPLGAAAWSTHQMDAGYPERGAALDYNRDGLLDVLVGKISSRVTTAPGQCAVLPPPGIAVVAPNGGENWAVGTQQTIQWTAQAASAAYDVDVSFDDGVSWAPVARQVIGTSCPFWVPEPSSNRARIRVMPVDLPVFADSSDARFTISGPNLASVALLGTGCGVPSAPLADATAPHLGAVCTLELVGAVANAPAAWFLSSPVSPPLLVGAGCFVFLDPGALTMLSFGTTTVAGRFDRGVVVPAAPGLVGLVLAAQPIVFGGGGPLGVQLGNGVRLTLGF